jgi:hypothetical protein
LSRPGPGEENVDLAGPPAHRLQASASAREPARLVEALELTLLIAKKEPHRHPRVAAVLAAPFTSTRTTP